MVIADLGIRLEERDEILRRPDRLVLPRRRTAVPGEDRLRGLAGRLARVADDHDPEARRPLDLGRVPTHRLAVAEEDLLLPADLVDPAADVVRVGIPRDQLEGHLLATAPDQER